MLHLTIYKQPLELITIWPKVVLVPIQFEIFVLTHKTIFFVSTSDKSKGKNKGSFSMHNDYGGKYNEANSLFLKSLRLVTNTSTWASYWLQKGIEMSHNPI